MNKTNDLMIETMTLLQKTFTVVDKTERERAEARLRELEVDLMSHLSTILTAVKDNQLLSNDLKLSVIIYLRKMIKTKIQDHSMTKDIAIELLKSYTDVILCQAQSDVCLQNMAHTLQDILNFRLVFENKQIVSDLVNLLCSYLESKVAGDIPSYKSLILLFENILLSASVSHSNAPEILTKMITSVELMLNYVISNGFAGLDIVNNKMVFLSYVDTCRLIFNFLHSSVVKLRSRLNIVLQVIDAYNLKFIKLASDLAMMTIPGIVEPQFISFIGDSEFDSTINMMKSKVFQFINSVITSYKSTIEEEYLVKIYNLLIQSCIDNLNYIILNKYVYVLEISKESLSYPDYNYETLLYQMILFLGRILVKDPFVNQFSGYSKQFVSSIIIPLLVGSNKEQLLMLEEGENYSNFIFDVIEEHKSKSLKSITAFILQNLCDRLDGLTSYVNSYCIQLVTFCMNGSDLNNIQQFNLITPEERIIKLTSQESQVETAFLIFSVLTSQIMKNKNQLDLLKVLFSNNLNTIFSINSEIVKDRLCLFIGIYLDNLFLPQDDKFSLCVEYLLINLLNYKNNQGVSHKAADALNDLVAVKKFSQAVSGVINKYLPTLIDQIEGIKIGLFFDVMLNIVIYVEIEENLLRIMQQLVKRVLAEIAPFTRIKFKVTSEEGKQSSQRREKDSQYNLIVNKCFNIIRTITDKSEYVIKYITVFEEILEPIFDHMKNPSKIDFDEDIVLIMTSFIKSLKRIPNSGLNLLPELPKYLKKTKGLMLDLYELVNNYIIYGHGIVDAKEDYNKIIMKIFRASFDIKCNYDKSPFLGANLMQVWLQTCTAIPQSMVKEIVGIAIDQVKRIIKYYKCKEDLEDSSDVFTFISILVLIYSAFIHYPATCLEAIITNNDIHNLIDWSQLYLKLKFYSTYQSKSLIIGICSIFKTESLVKEIADYIGKFLNILQVLLMKQKHEESKKLKNALKNEIDCNFVDSDEENASSEDEEEHDINYKINEMNNLLSKDIQKIRNKIETDEEYNGFTNEQEINDICERTINPVKNMDEYEYFKQSVEYLNSLDNSIWNSWINQLNDRDRENLNNLIHTRRVNISHDSILAQVPRKLLKIINRNQNPDEQL